MTRWARHARVFYVEEPMFGHGHARLDVQPRSDHLNVVVPYLPQGLSHQDAIRTEQQLLEQLVAAESLHEYVLWFYTPMAVSSTQTLHPVAVVYDCMDELSAFRGAPAELVLRERALLQIADVVTTGGHALYRAKQHLHRNVHPFPSSVDVAHFAKAREDCPDPSDQAAIPHIRIGFYGVIDERLDLDLVAGIAALRPNWNIVLVGPVVKIEPATLPQAPNLHYLGAKNYESLPAYLAGWDVAILPFARNEATRFISPTKTPEYLAAGRPVVSTSIVDVIEPYRRLGLVQIADEPKDFVDAVERSLQEDPARHRAAADAFLADKSWDATWASMAKVVTDAVEQRAIFGPNQGTPSRKAVRPRRDTARDRKGVQ
jgi:UDP-galactopyranose mutase